MIIYILFLIIWQEKENGELYTLLNHMPYGDATRGLVKKSIGMLVVYNIRALNEQLVYFKNQLIT